MLVISRQHSRLLGIKIKISITLTIRGFSLVLEDVLVSASRVSLAALAAAAVPVALVALAVPAAEVVHAAEAVDVVVAADAAADVDIKNRINGEISFINRVPLQKFVRGLFVSSQTDNIRDKLIDIR